MNTEIPNASQVRWQCRRGMLELDILLLSFFDKAYESLSLEQQKNFVELLTLPDQELYGCLTGRDQPNSIFEPIINQIRSQVWKE